MKFSIVTISYNQAPFLEECIRSVIEQDHPDVEYIIADGGSTDGSLAIIEKYRDRITKVLPGPDGGPADALNRAFAAASGDVFGFINSDDTLLPGALRQVATAWRDRTAIDFMSGHCLITAGDGRVLRRAYSDHFDFRRHAHGACILLQPATFFTRDLYRRAGGFNPANRVSWDAELFFEFGVAGARHAVLDAFLASYRVHQASITGENRSLETRMQLRAARLRRYLGREIHAVDRIRGKFYIGLRKLLNPRDTLARLVGGPIGGRFRKKQGKPIYP
jgi:glycosyltransferase involved in cell wall biosynthesis